MSEYLEDDIHIVLIQDSLILYWGRVTSKHLVFDLGANPDHRLNGGEGVARNRANASEVLATPVEVEAVVVQKQEHFFPVPEHGTDHVVVQKGTVHMILFT